jgi:hypothetical protein
MTKIEIWAHVNRLILGYAIVPLVESEFSLPKLPFIFGDFRNLKVAQHGNLLNSEINKYRNPGVHLSLSLKRLQSRTKKITSPML